MLSETISLQRLVNDMLELSRLQNKDFQIEKHPVDILMTLEDAIRAVRVISGMKQISVLYDKTEYEWDCFWETGNCWIPGKNWLSVPHWSLK